MDKIKVIVGNEELEKDKGFRLEELAKSFQKEGSPLIVSAKVNNILRELTYELTDKKNIVEFVDLKQMDGVRIYQRSLSFIFIRAAMEIYKDAEVCIEHSLSKGLFASIKKHDITSNEQVEEITERMNEIIKSDEPFAKEKLKKEEAINLFKDMNMPSKFELFKYRKSDYVNIYSCGWLKDYFYGYMVPSTGYINKFKLVPYDGGMILLHPTKYSCPELPEFEEQKKIAEIHREAEKWGNILNIGYVYNLNDIIASGQYPELIRISEALHEKKVANIADMITAKNKRLILIAGPSSSGKTTFANRLKIQLKVNGLNPITLSTDDYFVNRDRTPIDEEGKYDFESIDAVDTEQFNKDLSGLLRGEEVHIPTFNFQLGEREYRGNTLQIKENQPIIIEGIHGLNAKLTNMIDPSDKFKIYISCLTQLNIDNHNRIPTTDSRLIRRIVRDSKYRGHSALTTLKLWSSVRRGEERNIFPHQETADVMFNSALVYELAILKKHAEPLLMQIPSSEPEFMEAKRLLKFLSYFTSIENDKYVLQTSIVKEFIGGSAFFED